MAAQDADFVWGNYQPALPGKAWKRGRMSRARSYVGHVKSKVRKYSPKKKLKSIGKKIKRSLRRFGLFKKKSARSRTRSAWVENQKRSRMYSSGSAMSFEAPSGLKFAKTEMALLKQYPSMRHFMAAVKMEYDQGFTQSMGAQLLDKIDRHGLLHYFNTHPEYFSSR